MALLQDCVFCSLSVAASVIGVYTLVAYVIAFLLETWWIMNTPVSLPSPAYILCVGYFMVSVFSGILLRGLSIKNSLFLLEWLLVVAALFVPEALLVYFMSIHYWNIRSLYGLMELTCWVCRAIVNVSGMVCVQSLYSSWREEKEVLRRLRDLNLTRVIPNRRNSIATQANRASKNGGAAAGPQLAYSPPQMLNNGAFIPNLRRSASLMSMTRTFTPVMFPAPPFMTSEFNASQFDFFLQRPVSPQINKSNSLMDLRTMPELPRKTMSVIDFPVEAKEPKFTQSLDRRILKSHVPWNMASVSNGRLRNAYFPPLDPSLDSGPRRDLIYGTNINSFYPRKRKSQSKQSLTSDSDDFHKYKDIAL